MTHVAEADLSEITGTIWSSVLGLDVERSPQGVAPAAERTLAGCILITGAFDGAVVVECSIALAARVTARIFELDAGSPTEAQIEDALAELVNMTGGNVKGLLAEPSRLSLPVVVQGHDLTARLPGSHVVGRAAFACMGEPFVVSVHEREPAAPPP